MFHPRGRACFVWTLTNLRNVQHHHQYHYPASNYVPLWQTSQQQQQRRPSSSSTPTTLPSYSTSSNSMPEQPYSYHDASVPTIHIDLSFIGQETAAQEQSKRAAFDFSRQVQSALTQAQDAVWNGHQQQQSSTTTTSAMQRVQTLLEESPLIQSDSTRSPREANLSNRVEDYVRLVAFAHFLETSTLLPPPALATDEEYLAGACMGLAQDLQRYGLGRATVRDADSVQAAATLVSDILDYLLQFDFRNGPLRRKYDGTKWCLRTLETLLYELAITTGGDNDNDNNNVDQQQNPDSSLQNKAKRTKTESALLPNDLLKDIRKRMEERDQMRESLIKMCRDGQKAAKQSIFALHRGDRVKALQLLEKCQTCIQNDLQPIVDREPFLRQGSFANVLEEYVEAKLFATWMGDEPHKQPAGTILKFHEFPMTLTPEEYIGGLCDLTGEVGRFAVQRGTVRDTKGVQMSLQTNQAVLSGLQMMEHWPQSTGKKMNQVRQSVEKLQRMLYEMSLSEAAGGRNVKTDVEESGPSHDDE